LPQNASHGREKCRQYDRRRSRNEALHEDFIPDADKAGIALDATEVKFREPHYPGRCLVCASPRQLGTVLSLTFPGFSSV
jgi:hypothetical protein